MPIGDPLPTPATTEPTLANILRSVATAQLPSRFYKVLELGLPAAVQLWMWGMPRTAGWLIVLGAFGAWALLEQRIQIEADAIDPFAPGRAPTHRWLKIGRAAAGAGGAVLGTGLALELVARALSLFVRCLGCAG